MSTATAAPTTVRSRGIPEQYKAILQQTLVVTETGAEIITVPRS